MMIERKSTIDAPVEQAWSRVISPEGINDEMRPWMTMTRSAGRRVDDGRHRRAGQACRPRLAEARRWEHERILTPGNDGRTTVHDRVTFQTGFLLPITPLSRGC